MTAIRRVHPRVLPWRSPLVPRSSVRLAVLVVLSASACGAFVAAVSASPVGLPTVITLGNVGGVRPGMSPAKVSKAWGIPVNVDFSMAFPSCGAATIQTGAKHGQAWFTNSVFASVEFDRGVRTAAGITIGSSAASMRRAYGAALRFQPQPYAPPPGILDYYIRSSHRPFTYIYFSMKNGHVRQIRFGGDFVFEGEGCA